MWFDPQNEPPAYRWIRLCMNIRSLAMLVLFTFPRLPGTDLTTFFYGWFWIAIVSFVVETLIVLSMFK